MGDGVLVIAFLWGLAEATLFFIVPDVYLGLVALFHWRRGLLATMAALAGALAGGAIMYTLAAGNSPAMTQVVLSVPLIKPVMMEAVAEQFRAAGLGALLTEAWQGIPYKVFAVQAAQQRVGLLSFLVFTIPARLERFLPTALACGALGAAFRPFIRRHRGLVLGTYALFWIAVYIAYYFLVS